MPKVVTRGVVSSSEQSKATKSSRAVLRSYYCLCGDFVLVLQGKLERLPRRRRDNAYIIRSQSGPKGQPARKFKLNAQPGQRCLIRLKGTQDLEVRQRFLCGRCNATVAYQPDPPPAGTSPFLYILKGAVTELQGRIPPDAFEGEQALIPNSNGQAKNTDRLGEAAEEEEDLAAELGLGPAPDEVMDPEVEAPTEAKAAAGEH